MTDKRFTEESYSKFKRKILQQLGFVNAELRRKQELNIILNRCNITTEDLELIGWGYKEETNQIGKLKEMTFEDIKDLGLVEEPAVQEVQIIPMTDNCNTMSYISENIDTTQLESIIGNYDILMEMIDIFKKNKSVNCKDNSIVIELPFEDDKMFKATYRVNKVIHEQFKEFCKQHKEFTVKDLISMALKEYMDNHK